MTRELHPLAEEELHDSAHGYAAQSIFAADRFMKAVEEAIQTVVGDPARFQSVGEGVRVYRLQRFPYKLYDEYDEGRAHVRVLFITPNKQRPDEWRHRVSKG